MTHTTLHSPTGHKWRWVWVVLSLLMMGVVLVVIWEAEDTADVTVKTASLPAPVISVLDIAADRATAKLTAFAELRPRWDAEIRTAVSGKITKVHDSALAGERVEAGAALFAIEKTRYETAVAAAELSLEQARLGLWRAENAVALARREFKRAGTKPPNDLALRLPELRIAERTVTSAEAELDAARRQLASTEVTAPFSGFITKRMASLGQTVTAGEPLVHLSDDRHYELAVELTQADWALLDHPVAGQRAKLTHRDGTPLGGARIRRGGGFLDPMTRQRRIHLDVTGPDDTVMAGDFVRVTFTGRVLTDTLSIPETALTRAGHVWRVDAHDRLVRTDPQILFREGATLVISAPKEPGPFRIAVAPLASFLPGQQVTPIRAEE